MKSFVGRKALCTRYMLWLVGLSLLGFFLKTLPHTLDISINGSFGMIEAVITPGELVYL